MTVPSLVAPPPASADDRYRAGTLTYTKAGLAALFVWLLWGDFCFQLVENVPELIPILLKDHGASNQEIAFIVGTIASLFTTVITPVVSYRSDRHRGRRGRRIPFLIWPVPFIVLLLALLPYSPEIARALMKCEWIARILACSPVSPVILVFGFFTAGFQLFNMVMAPVYYYLFNDVVPPAFLGRFFGLFRLACMLSGFVFNYFIFGMVQSHSKELFLGLAALYGAAFGLMCWRVKEGEYPPVTDEPRGSWTVAVRNYFVQSFSHSHYFWIYLASMAYNWSAIPLVFAVFFYRDELGLSLDTIGKFRSWCVLPVIPLVYLFGLLVDRWKSQRVTMLGTALLALTNVGCFFFIQGKWTYLASLFVTALPFYLLNVANAAWFPDMLPKARYGQLTSASSLLTAVTLMVLNPVCGWVLDWLHNYRFIFIWAATFQALSFLIRLKIYRNWRKYGGPDHYQAP